MHWLHTLAPPADTEPAGHAAHVRLLCMYSPARQLHPDPCGVLIAKGGHTVHTDAPCAEAKVPCGHAPHWLLLPIQFL